MKTRERVPRPVTTESASSRVSKEVLAALGSPDLLKVPRNDEIDPANFVPRSRFPDRTLTKTADQVDSLVTKINSGFQAAANKSWTDIFLAHRTALELMTAFIDSTTFLEELGWSSDRIKVAFASSRRVFAESVFMKRCQEWPRGYAGDFETIEYLVGAVNESEPRSIGWYFEQILFESSATHQHRNKLKHQTAEILHAIEGRPDARIFSLACGGCLDWIGALPSLGEFAGEIVLNDCDAAALELAARRLTAVTNRFRLAPGNILRVAGRLPKEAKFDLVVAGGLFDYLSDRAIVSLLRTTYGSLLASRGVLLFTNMAQDNPWRTLMEYGSDWQIIQRSEEQIELLCTDAGIKSSDIELARDATGLTLLVRVVRHD